MGVPGMLLSSSFLISVCMFIVSKALLISSATVIVRAWGTNWLNPFAMLLFTECSAVTVECCILYPCCVGVFGMFERLCKEEGSTLKVPTTPTAFGGTGSYVRISENWRCPFLS